MTANMADKIPTTRLRVVIVDDHPVMAHGLRSALEASGPVEIASAGDARTAVELVRRMRPDVLVIDLRFAEQTGDMDVIARAVVDSPGTRILVMSQAGRVMSQAGRAEVLEALKAGAHGYVDRAASDAELVTAVWAVRASAVLPSELAELLLLAEVHHPPGGTGFTARELDVLRCLAKGYNNHEIARALQIGVRTVNRHIDRIRDKIGQRRRSSSSGASEETEQQ
jgi:Response regulator containing a CheY-like receiver domain and an HTH DNA-binding domain